MTSLATRPSGIIYYFGRQYGRENEKEPRSLQALSFGCSSSKMFQSTCPKGHDKKMMLGSWAHAKT